jgi:hypothetical protein
MSSSRFISAGWSGWDFPARQPAARAGPISPPEKGGVTRGILGNLLGDRDAVKTNRGMQAMLKMHKLDVAQLKQAHEWQ